MFTRTRRIIGPAVVTLFLVAGAYPVFGQTYVANPVESDTASITENSIGTATNVSQATGGFPSVNTGGTATVNFTFSSSFQVFRAGGAAIFQYESDRTPTWTGLAGFTSTTPAEHLSHSVNVTNLSTLRFRMFVTASVQCPGCSASVEGSAGATSVSVP
ncbi:MAG TPA: hypothetical protein VFW25_14625 [Silvibacterium sp.]|nr:hypothetical protein [Silvibacterium sp.]